VNISAQRRRQRNIHLLIGVVVLIGLLAVNGPPLVAFAQHEYRQYKINTAAYKRKNGH
jgi:hypothetical protein